MKSRNNGASGRAVMVALTLCVVGASAGVADSYVAQSGQTPVSPYDSWANAASNIQAAVDAASAGDTVRVRAGTYTASAGDNVVSINKALSLRSETGDPALVIIDGQGARRGLYATLTTEGANLLIDGITVTNGRVASGFGGGIYIKHTGITGGTAVVQRCTITGNYSGVGDGGGMCSLGQSNTVFHTMVSDSRIVGNTQALGSTWTADTGDPAGFGGGAAFRRTRLTLQDCTVQDNVSRGGAAWYEGSRGGGLYLYQLSANSVIRRCTIARNEAPDTKGSFANCGAGLNITGSTGNNVLIENSVIQSNGYMSGTWGGGVANVGGKLVLRGCLVSHNSSDAYGSAFLSYGTTAFTVLESSTVASNNPTATYNNQCLRLQQGTLSISNSIVYHNAVANYGVGSGTTLTWSHSCTTPLPAGTDNISTVPNFVSLSAGDFRLQTNSPCLDAGTNLAWMLTARDLDNHRRIDGKSGIVDMGAYELTTLFGTAVMIR